MQTDTELMDDFRISWKDGALSSSKKLERLRAFFRFAQKRRSIVENPAVDLKPPKITPKPTMPFTQDEMSKIMSAVDLFLETAAGNGLDNAKRIRGLILVLRYTGMRISNAVGLPIDRVKQRRVFLYTQKTGVPVYTVLPDFVIDSTHSARERSIFFLEWPRSIGDRSSELADAIAKAFQNCWLGGPCSPLQRHASRGTIDLRDSD